MTNTMKKLKRRRDEESYKDDQLEFANGKQTRVSLSLALIHRMTRWKNDLAEGGKEGFKEERKLNPGRIFL